MRRLIRYTFLTVITILSSCVEEAGIVMSYDHVYFSNNSSETVVGIYSYYNDDGYDPMMNYVFKCLPAEKEVFPFTKHAERPIAVKIYREGDVDFKNIDYLPAKPLAYYLLSLDQLRKHNWTFTYPPSEPWMQSGIKEIGIN